MKLLDKIGNYIKIDHEIESFFTQQCQTKVYKKGIVLSNEKQYNHTVYYVEKGLMRMFYFQKDKDITTNFYSEGNITANFDTLFQNKPSRYGIETLEDCVITTCNFKELEALCSKSLSLANFSRYIYEHLILQMSARIVSLQHMTAKEKYVQLLEENPSIVLRAPLGMIATYLGISQETLSRIRSGL